MNRRSSIRVAFTLALAFAPLEALAAPGGLQDRKVRINAEIEPFGWTRQGSWDQMTDTHIDSVGFGVGRLTSSDRGLGGAANAGFFVGNSLLSLGVGGIIANRVVVGARAGVTFDAAMPETQHPAPGIDQKTRSVLVGGNLTPYVHVLFLDQQMVRPFIEVRGGFGGGRFSNKTTLSGMGQDLSMLTAYDFIYPTVGVAGGAHFFLLPRMSLDAAVGVDGRWVYQRQVTDDGTTEMKEDWAKSVWEVSLGVALGLSIWI